MSIVSSLNDFTFPEIIQFIERGHKSGLLSVSALPVSQSSRSSNYYIWVYQGGIVGAANRLDTEGLVELIEQCQWISDRVLDKLVHWCCPLDQPLGLYLKNQGALGTVQLKKLFSLQIVPQVCALCQLTEGIVKFDQNAPIPTRELTGFTIPATEAMLMGLQVLPNWDALTEQLPTPKASLVSMASGKTDYRHS